MKHILAILLCFCSNCALFAQYEQNSFINGITHNNQSITSDLPGSQHIKNIGSKIDDAGMCVFTSIEMAALHAGLEQMRGFRDWVADNYRGGGWPEKVVECLDAYFKVKKIPKIKFIQYEGKNPEILLDMCEKTGRMAGMTYGFSPRYGGPIQHMTNAVMFRGDYGVVLDNNFPGEDRYEWVTHKEFIRRTIYPNRTAWLFVWCPPAPPPSPKNRSAK